MIQLPVDAEGNLHVPSALWQEYSIVPGESQVYLVQEADGFRVVTTKKKADLAFIRSLRGKYKTEGVTMQDFLDLKAEDMRIDEEQYQRHAGK